jgi:nucleotide-binding universal stress UspA family protein
MSRTSEVAAPATIDLLIATDGTRDADGAVRVGRALALRDGAAAELVSVVEPFPLHAGAEGTPLPDVHQLTTLMAESRAAALLEQRDRTHPGIHDWPFEIDVGPRAEMIAANAERKGASLILMGLGEHGVTARLMQRETALQVMRAASVPVLALPRDAWGIPHSAVVAIDFTASSERAAAAALDLLGGEGTLYVAHVLPRTMIPHAEPPAWEDETTAGTLKRLEAVVRRLDPPHGVHVEYVLLHGDPAHELLAFAEETNADLVAAGAHGRSALGRLLMGSVSTRLVRTAECWVLVAPADGSAAPL